MTTLSSLAAQWMAKSSRMRHLACIAVAAILSCPTHTTAAPPKAALLVGVGTYASSEVPPLEGPANDVAAMRKVLLERMGMQEGAVRTLVDGQATRSAIVAELNDLLRRSAPGDTVLVYFSGHGTSALDGNFGVPLPHGSGAFVPYDLDLRAKDPQTGLIKGRDDLRPVFEKLDTAGRFVWFISDSCYSGQQVRSVLTGGERLPARMIGMPDADDLGALRLARQRAGQGNSRELVWPYKNVVFLAASAEGERAVDIPQTQVGRYATVDGKAHGAMTDALLRVLSGKEDADFDANGTVNVHEIHGAVVRFMSGRSYGHTPQRLPFVTDDHAGAASRALFAAPGGAVSGKVTVAPFVVTVDPALPSRIGQALAGIPGVHLEAGRKGIQIKPAAGQNTVQILSPTGDRITALPLSDMHRLQGQVAQLAWAHQLDTLALRGSRAALQAEITPSVLGGNFILGDTLAFAVKPDRDAKLLLVNVDSHGKVSVLYPFDVADLRVIEGDVVRYVPGNAPHQRIKVTEPLGLDVQFLFAFDRDGPDLSQWINVINVPAGDGRLARLSDLIERYRGKYTYARSEIRVLPQ